ncbi:MEU26 [Hepatospora eriocheir]|uniref:MEU26 n=1 Tax=Hepatospora eriocheir TaxID=1081669 RepID=A0A1X0QA84_9MICR|nr:MEU26 [Hepatospora eriocheir]
MNNPKRIQGELINFGYSSETECYSDCSDCTSYTSESRLNDNEKENGLEKAQYKPKSIRYEGKDREGLCEICKKWFKLRTSSYWYHMNYKHGICSNYKKILDPITRIKSRLIQGYCMFCKDWIDLSSISREYIYSWYRHFIKTHHNKLTKPKNYKSIRNIPYKKYYYHKYKDDDKEN